MPRSPSSPAVVALCLAALGAGCGEEGSPVDGKDPPIHTPRWAFSPWISKDISSGPDTRDFVAGFRSRDIPVGVVVLDSPWETNYNSFVPNPDRYPDFEGMVGELRGQGLRVVLWITQMINDDSFDLEPGGDTYRGPSPNYATARDRGYFVNDSARYFWWKGTGSAIDFFDPEAVRWWRAQQDPLLEAGVAGFKLDFGESYITTPTIATYKGEVTLQEYSEAYYRDFYVHGVAKRGAEELVTMVRPYDRSYGFEGRFFARKEHAPAAWVGDNRRDYVGLADALDHVFRSAAAGYVVVGSDIGGYLDRDDLDLVGPVIPFDVEVFARWTALGAMMPFMQLHGRANITPWTVPERADEIVAVYRYWSKLHEELVPFYYSLAEEAYAGRSPPIIRPIGAEASWPGDYRYQVGEAFLVAPLLDGTGARQVALPSGDRWYDWWSPEAAPLLGGQTVTSSFAADLAKIPLFVREGAIIPVSVRDELTGLGSTASRGALTLLIYPSRDAPSSFTVHHEDGSELDVSARAAPGGAGFELSVSHAPATLLLRVRAEGGLSAASVDGAPLAALESREALAGAETGVLREGGLLVVKLPARSGQLTVLVTP